MIICLDLEMIYITFIHHLKVSSHAVIGHHVERHFLAEPL